MQLLLKVLAVILLLTVFIPVVSASNFDMIPASVFVENASLVLFTSTCKHTLKNFKLISVINTIQNEASLPNENYVSLLLNGVPKYEVYFQLINLKNGSVYRTPTHTLWSKDLLRAYITNINTNLVKE